MLKLKLPSKKTLLPALAKFWTNLKKKLANLPQHQIVKNTHHQLKHQLKTRPKSHLILFATICFLGATFLQIMALSVKSNINTSQWQKSQAEAKAKKDQEYQALLQRQEQRNLEKEQQKQPPDLSHPKLIGVNHLYIFFVKPPDTSQQAIQPLVDTLSSFSGKNYSNLNSLHTYFHQQAQKYSPEYFDVIIDTYPEVTTLDITRVGDIMNNWGKDIFSLRKLQDQFATIIKEKGITLDDKHHAVFIYFDNSYQNDSDVYNSFYDMKTFRSFSDEGEHQAYVNAYSFSTAFAPTLVEIIAHESLHLFGANDKYLENEYGCEAEGRGEPDKTPLFPQKTTDIMCGLIEYREGKFVPAYFEDDEIIINPITAKEIGWE